ncbi:MULTISPECIES: hypothetical protein [Sphingobacterium]|uniref:hypothetical protein n=1 Tax=Sphingobacterium TaxID=28453 RepID=UPI0013DA67FE|nr:MULTISPECIES: hypothetical protein [unclassified Sphingobacterium]
MSNFIRHTAPNSRPYRESLDLNKMGLHELNTEEMVEVEGGALFKAKGLLSWVFGANSRSDVEIEVLGWEIK